MNSLNVEENGKSIIQNILFVESPSANGTFYMPLIARYYPSAELDIKDFQEIYYNKIPADWSGTLDIWTYDERFFVGFGIEDGQITTTRHPDIASSIENSSKKDPSINHLVSCQRYRITIVIHNIVCAGANNCHVTQGETEYRYVTECTVSGGAGPSSGSLDPIYNYPGSGGGGATGTIGDSGDIEVIVPLIPTPKVIKRLNCIELKNTHGREPKDLWQFRNQYYNKTYEEIINIEKSNSLSFINSQAGGPGNSEKNGYFRYVRDPLNPNIIIDMRHLLVIGNFGRSVGESVELIQWLANNESAFDHQDYYSNELGYSFFEHFGHAIKFNPSATTDYLVTFLNNPDFRNATSTPERCK